MAAVSLRRNFSPPRNRLQAALEPADFALLPWPLSGAQLPRQPATGEAVLDPKRRIGTVN
jgi:hypothetical protein